MTTASFPVAAGTFDDTWPSVSSPLANGDYMVAWSRDFGTDHDIYGALITGGTVIHTLSLNGLENSSELFEDQLWPHVDSDGTRFALAYSETFNGDAVNKDVYLSSFYELGGFIGLSEARINFASSPRNEQGTDLVSTNSTGGAARRYALALYVFVGHGDIAGGFYDGLDGGPITSYCWGDGSATLCPCGNTGGGGALLPVLIPQQRGVLHQLDVQSDERPVGHVASLMGREPSAQR